MALPIIKHKKKTASYSDAAILTCCTCMMGGAQMCMHSMRKPAISSYLKWCQVRVNKMETWALLRYYTVYVCINYVRALWISSPLVVYDAIDNASSSRAHGD